MTPDPIILVIAAVIIAAGIAKGLGEYHKDKQDTESGNFLIPEED